MGYFGIEPRPITSLPPSPRECTRQAVLFLVGRHDAPLGSSHLFKGKPRLPKGTGLEFDNGETLEVSCLTITSTQQCCIRFRGIPSAGFGLPFQIFRLPGRRGTQ